MADIELTPPDVCHMTLAPVCVFPSIDVSRSWR